MKHTILAGCVVCLPLVQVQGEQQIDSIAVVVNGEPISRSQVQTQVRLLAMEAYRAGMTEEQFREIVAATEKNALDTLIDRKLILSKFREMGAQIRPQMVDETVDRFIRERFEGDRQKFIVELGKKGLSFKQFRDSLEETMIVQAMRAREVCSEEEAYLTPSEEAVITPMLTATEESEFRASVRIRTITIPKTRFGDCATEVKQKALVEEIYKKLKGGVDFASMARANSVDPGAAKGGERGTFTKENLSSDLSEVAFRIPVGTASEPFEVEDRAYVILLVEARHVGRFSLLDPKGQQEVRMRMQQDKRKKKVNEFLARLRRDANIKYFDGVGH